MISSSFQVVKLLDPPVGGVIIENTLVERGTQIGKIPSLTVLDATMVLFPLLFLEIAYNPYHM